MLPATNCAPICHVGGYACRTSSNSSDGGECRWARSPSSHRCITRDDLTGLWKEIGWRGYRTQEPVDVVVEQPVVFKAAIAIHRNEHGLSDSDLARIAGVSAETLGSLFHDYFRSATHRAHLSVVSARTLKSGKGMSA